MGAIRTITTWEQEFAPPHFRWAACWGEYDEGATVGNGSNEHAAIMDLVLNYDLPPAIREERARLQEKE